MKKIAKKGEKERLFYYLDLSNAHQPYFLGNKKGRVLWELEIFLEKIAKNPDINLDVGITDLERAQQYKEKYGFDLKILGYREYNPL